MKTGWKVKRLKEVCEKITDGTHQTPKYFDEGIIFLSSKNVTSGKIDWDNVKYIDESQHKEMHKRVAPKVGDILLAKNGTTGVAAIVDKDVVFDIYVSLAHIRSLGEVSPEYMLYFINSPLAKSQFDKRLKGIGVPNLHLKEIREVEIPFPISLEKQKQIIKILDQAFEAIDKAKANIEKNIQNADELFQSKLNEIFSQKGEGWEEKKLNELCHVLNGYAFKSKEAIGKSNTQLLRMGNLYNNILDLKRKPVFYPDSFKINYKDYLLKEGDLIMSLTGTVDKTDYGYTVKVPSTNVDLLLNQRIMKIEIDDSKVLNKDYLMNHLLSPEFLSRLYATASGTRQANLSSKKIMDLKISYPMNIKEQLVIVKNLKNLRDSSSLIKQQYVQKLKNLEELKNSILQKAFKGELTNKTVEV